MYFTVIENL